MNSPRDKKPGRAVSRSPLVRSVQRAATYIEPGLFSRARRSVRYAVAVFAVLLFWVGDSCSEKYAGEFLSLGIGARSLAMGSAFVALSDDATAPYWNPAGSSQLAKRQVFLQHSERFEGVVKCDGGSYVHPIQELLGARGAVGIAVTRLGVDDIPVTEVPNPGEDPGEGNRPRIVGTIKTSYYVGYLNYSRRAGEKVALGGSFKILQADLGRATGLGAGADIGAILRVHPKLALGMSVRDATTTILSWDTGTREYVMPTACVGYAYSTPVGFPRGDFSFAGELDFQFENRRTASQFAYDFASGESRVGAEYTYRKVISGRIGFDAGHLTFGAGVSYRDFCFDYAHLDHEDLGATTRISGSYSF